MTQEEKQLLLKDLCARLPYSPICHIVGENGAEIDDILTTSTIQNLDVWVVKPYLRPMSSMTEEEWKEYCSLCEPEEGFDSDNSPIILAYNNTIPSFDWLLAHHFDFRGLIEKCLAIEVTKDNNPYNINKEIEL